MKIQRELLNVLTILGAIITAFPELPPSYRLPVAGICWCLQRMGSENRQGK